MNPKYLQGTVCQDDCNDGFYPDTSKMKCTTCDAVCATCNGGYNYNCLSCAGTLFLFGSSCLASCPAGTSSLTTPFNQCITCDGACQTCTGPTADDCVACKNSYLMISGSTTCVQVCPNGYFDNLATMTCLACTSGCKKCKGAGLTDCVACFTKYLQPQNTGG